VKNHKAGFISIVGKPNVGKSTLMNAVLGESISIVTAKAQTTRHRIRGILNTEDYQLVFSDTPGIMDPSYKLHQRMLNAVKETFEDADLVLFVTEVKDRNLPEEAKRQLEFSLAPLFVLINKIDTSTQEDVEAAVEYWNNVLKPAAVFPISALHSFHTDVLLKAIIDKMPEAPPYFEKGEEVSDRNVRFFVSEMIRERILNLYQKEIPYSVEIAVTSYKESEDIDRIYVTIFCERETQKAILLGHQGKAIKKLGIESRKRIEEFISKKVHLELTVKVADDWRNNERMLRDFGYE
jgi:GTP-binding protein Era